MIILPENDLKVKSALYGFPGKDFCIFDQSFAAKAPFSYRFFPGVLRFELHDFFGNEAYRAFFSIFGLVE